MPSSGDQARAIARYLDNAVRIPGTSYRIGLDPVIGLIPGVGDLVGTGLSVYILWLGVRSGVPAPVLARMFVNVAIDLAIGAIPLVGDLFDLGWKANSRNVELIEDYLDDPRRTKRGSYLFLALLVVLIVALLAAALWVGAQIVQGVAGLFG